MRNSWPQTLRRRDAIAALAGVAMGWPSAARAQRPERVRRVGVLMNLPHDHPDAPARAGAFENALEGAGWTIGRSVSIEYRWSGTTDIEPLRRYARELFALDPDVVVVAGRWNVIAESATSNLVPAGIATPPICVTLRASRAVCLVEPALHLRDTPGQNPAWSSDQLA